MTHNPTGPRVPAGPVPAEDPRTGPPGVNPWIPSLATVLEKQQHAAPSQLTPPAGATGFTGLSGPAAARPGEPSAHKPALYGARAINQPIPEYVVPTRRPRRRTNHALILLIVLVVLAAGAGAGYWFLQHRNAQASTAADAATENRAFTLPSTFQGLRERPIAAATLASQFAGPGQSALYSHAAAATYGSGATQSLVVIAVRPKDDPDLYRDMTAHGVASSVDSFTAGVTRTLGPDGQSVTPQVMDPGVEGGAMRCLAFTITSGPVGACVWGDRSFLTLTLVTRPTTTEATAQLVRSLRAAAEH